MPRISVAKVEKSNTDKDEVIRLLATLCHYYPAYTLKEAKKLPYKHLKIMISQAKRLEANHYFNLTQISAAPHSKKGVGVKKLTEAFKKEVKNG